MNISKRFCLVLILLIGVYFNAPVCSQFLQEFGDTEKYSARLGIYYRPISIGSSIGVELTRDPLPNSPLSQSQIQLERGDLITKLDGIPISRFEQLEKHFDKTEVTFINIRTKETEIRLADLPPLNSYIGINPPPGNQKISIDADSKQKLDENQISHLCLRDDTGLLILPLDQVTRSAVSAVGNLAGRRTPVITGKKGERVRILEKATGIKNDDAVYLIVNGRANEIQIDRSGKELWYKIVLSDGANKGKSGWVPIEKVVNNRQFEVKLRVFIPSPIVALGFEDRLPPFGDPTRLEVHSLMRTFGGDDRSFSYEHGTSRAQAIAKIGLTDENPFYVARWGQTTSYSALWCRHVSGKPIWWYEKINPFIEPIESTELVRTEDNFQVKLENSYDKTGVNFRLSGSNPLLNVAPPIDADITVGIRRLDQIANAEFRVIGFHDAFPAYELYLDKKLIYSYEPSRSHPLALIGKGTLELDTGWKNVP